VPLPHPDNLHLNAAQGWLMLGDVAAAQSELEQMAAASRSDPETLETAWEVHAAKQAWPEAFAAADQLVHTAPDRDNAWIHLAFAARRMPGGGLETARTLLLPAVTKFPQQFLIPYNLSCYAAQLGRLDEAWDWLQRAMTVGHRRNVSRMALRDEDLEPLWPRLRAESRD
jgi:tetratricopeptide (TPR) repeat protein